MEFRDIENMLRVAADKIDIHNDPLRLLTDRERMRWQIIEFEFGYIEIDSSLIRNSIL